MVSNYIEQLLILVCASIGCVSVFSFASLVSIFICTSSSAVASRICAINARIQEHDKMVFLATTKLNSIKVLISKALIDSDVIHVKSVSANSILIWHNDINNQRSNQRGNQISLE